ncbi:MAG: AI-2E family transporter [Chloroflexi bacterium]|nr:AI-2E family transporter [Chloroflexota bacterium]
MFTWFSNPKLRLRALLIAVLLGLVLLLFSLAWTALLPFLVGLFIAYLLMPFVDFFDRRMPRFLRRWGMARPIAIVVVYIVTIGAVVGILSYFIPLVANQVRQLIDLAGSYIPRLEQLAAIDLDSYLERIPPNIRAAIDANIRQISTTLATAIQRGLTLTIRTVSQAISFVLGMIIIPFWLFYVLNDKAAVQRAFYQLVPEAVRKDVYYIGRIIDDLLSAYIRGQLLLCLLVGAMATVALAIIGVDLAIALGTFAGIFELIPVLGPYIGAIPAILIALLDQPIKALWTAVAFAAIQQIENIFLVPRISGNAVRFHPAVVMVIVVVGAQVAGIWGLLIGVPVAAIFRDVYQYLYLRTTERGATPEMAMETLRARIL